MKKVSEWGFNCVRFMLTYQTLFDKDVTKVNQTNLEKLDAVVAAAIAYNLHLNIVTFSLPGRWTVTDFETYTSTASLDLFTNTARQKEANAVWALLAERYQDIPSATLSFCPLWEAQNYSLSSGLPVDEYGVGEVAKVYSGLIATIREQDPDRYIVYEPTAGNEYARTITDSQVIKDTIEDRYADVLMISNFCEMPFVYAEMTAVQGQHIDHNNHSMFKPEYPVTIYETQYHLDKDSPLELKGELVKGTQIDLYLSKIDGNGTFEITADGNSLYSEQLFTKNYTVEYPLSGYYPYAKSDKRISITLTSDVNSLQIKYNGNWFEWSGIDVTLPTAKYAVKRWWFMSGYDALLTGTELSDPVLKSTSNIMISPYSYDTGRVITINPDVTYSSSEIHAQSNKQTIDEWGKAMAEFSPSLLVRVENASFNVGSEYQSSIEYYDDFLSMCDEHGFSWFSNEFVNISTYYSQTHYAGGTRVPSIDSYILVDMLKVFQKHLPAPITVK